MISDNNDAEITKKAILKEILKAGWHVNKASILNLFYLSFMYINIFIFN